MMTRMRGWAAGAVLGVGVVASGCATVAGGGDLENTYRVLVADAVQSTPPRPDVEAMARLAQDAVSAARARVEVAEQVRAYGLMARAVLWAGEDEGLAAPAREWLLEGRRVCDRDDVAAQAPRECGVLGVAFGVLEGEQALGDLVQAPRGTEPWRGAAAATAGEAVSGFRANAAAQWTSGARRLAVLEDVADEDLAVWYAAVATTQFCVLRNRVGLGVIDASIAFFPVTGEDARRVEDVKRDYRAIRADVAAFEDWWALEPGLAAMAGDWADPAQDVVFERYANDRCTLLFEARGLLAETDAAAIR